MSVVNLQKEEFFETSINSYLSAKLQDFLVSFKISDDDNFNLLQLIQFVKDTIHFFTEILSCCQTQTKASILLNAINSAFILDLKSFILAGKQQNYIPQSKLLNSLSMISICKFQLFIRIFSLSILFNSEKQINQKLKNNYQKDILKLIDILTIQMCHQDLNFSDFFKEHLTGLILINNSLPFQNFMQSIISMNELDIFLPVQSNQNQNRNFNYFKSKQSQQPQISPLGEITQNQINEEHCGRIISDNQSTQSAFNKNNKTNEKVQEPKNQFFRNIMNKKMKSKNVSIKAKTPLTRQKQIRQIQKYYQQHKYPQGHFSQVRGNMGSFFNWTVIQKKIKKPRLFDFQYKACKIQNNLEQPPQPIYYQLNSQGFGAQENPFLFDQLKIEDILQDGVVAGNTPMRDLDSF